MSQRATLLICLIIAATILCATTEATGMGHAYKHLKARVPVPPAPVPPSPSSHNSSFGVPRVIEVYYDFIEHARRLNGSGMVDLIANDASGQMSWVGPQF